MSEPVQHTNERNGESPDTHLSEKSNRKKALSRFDHCLNKKLQNEQKRSVEPQPRPSPSRKVFVEEFLPSNSNDSTFPVLRQIFIDSFNQYYKEIEEELKLNTNTTLVQWLDETFDDMQKQILEKVFRCLMLRSIDKQDANQGIIGFLTLKEEGNGSVYISQCAIDARNKRSGYGGLLVRHLRNIYPAGTYYWGLCRRENKPAVKFYLKQGARFIKDEDVGKKYGYDPQLYTGFQFLDQSTENTLSRQEEIKAQENPTIIEPLPEPKKRSWLRKLICSGK